MPSPTSAEGQGADAVFSLQGVLRHLDTAFPDLVVRTLAEAALALSGDVGALLECGREESQIAFCTDESLVGITVAWVPASSSDVQIQNQQVLGALNARSCISVAFVLAHQQYVIVLAGRAGELDARAFFQIESSLVDTMSRLLLRRYKADDVVHLDHVTGLPDRRTTVSRIDEVILAANRTGRRAGLLFIDVNKFKEINDNFGHPYGDGILRRIAIAMQDALRTNETVGRIGGDEFAVVIPVLSTAEDALKVSRRLTQALSVYPFPAEIPRPSLSIGIAIYPDHGTDQAAWINAADRAMYEAKRHDAPACVYDRATMSSPPTVRLNKPFRGEPEFLLCFQPIFDALNSRTCAAEAFVRWLRPVGGLASAHETMERARTNDCETSLDMWVIENANTYARKWRTGHVLERVHVNISARTPEGLTSLCGKLVKSNVDAAGLALEFNITALSGDGAGAQQLKALAEKGFQLGLEGFGLGALDLWILQSLPMDFAKLSPGLLPSVVGSNDRLLRAIVALVKELGWEPIASRIASFSDRKAITEAGVTKMQGFAFAQPMTAVDFETWLTGDAGHLPETPLGRGLVAGGGVNNASDRRL